MANLVRWTKRTPTRSQQHSFIEQIAEKFNGVHSNFVLGSIKENNPIVYCTDGFCELTQYKHREVMRRSCTCNFLYGIKTPQSHIDGIRNALRQQEEYQLRTIFYKKDGTSFECLFDILPIKNDEDKVIMFVASHKDVTRTACLIRVEDENENKATQFSERSSLRRRNSRAVLYHLSEQLRINGQSKTEADKMTDRLVLTANDANEVHVKHIQKPMLLILHYSRLKSIWDWCVIAMTFLIALIIPFCIAFDKYDIDRSIFILPEAVFILDIIFNFRTTYINKNGRIVYETRMIAKHYVRTWFIVDLIAALPIALIISYAGPQPLEIRCLTLLKVIRLLHLVHIISSCDRKSEYNAAILALLVLSFAALAHWLACIWYFIGVQELNKPNNQRNPSWLYDLSMSLNQPFYNRTHGGPSLQAKYITAIYFTLSSLTTVGFGNVSGNTTAEKIFAVVMMIIGSLMYAVIFGNVTAIIQRLYSARSKFRSRMYDIRQFCHAYHLPEKLKHRLEDFIYTAWSVTNGINKDEILKTLPIELQADICTYLHRDLLHLPIFEKVGYGCLRSLSSKIQTSYCAPSEIVIHQGEVYHPLYFVASGTIQILVNETVVAILGQGDLIGEYPIHNKSQQCKKSNGTVKAMTYCDLRFIQYNDLVQILLAYPELEQALQADWHLAFNLAEEEVCIPGQYLSLEIEDKSEENRRTPNTVRASIKKLSRKKKKQWRSVSSIGDDVGTTPSDRNNSSDEDAYGKIDLERKSSGVEPVKILVNPLERTSTRRREAAKGGIRYTRAKSRPKSITGSPYVLTTIRRAASEAEVSEMLSNSMSDRRPSDSVLVRQSIQDGSKSAVSKFSIKADPDTISIDQQFDDDMKKLMHKKVNRTRKSVTTNEDFESTDINNESQQAEVFHEPLLINVQECKKNLKQESCQTEKPCSTEKFDPTAKTTTNLEAIEEQMSATWEVVNKMNDKLNLLSEEMIMLTKSLSEMKELMAEKTKHL